ncbi:MAG: hypothetical protein J5I94_14455 [Phaeodactylibacter sp.]|nr:hypothetical protein [Phaeodactylibacter sp.]
MKLFTFKLFLIAALMFFAGCSGNAQSQGQKKAAAAAGESRIEVLDFHTEHRCKACLAIEQFTKEVLAETYAGEMDKGVITFRLINADEEANAAIVEKYLAFGTTLIINTVAKGGESHVDLTSFAFMNAGNEAKFKAGLKEQLEASLKKIRS